MAFLKRLKEKVTKPEASISIVLNKDSYSLGEELTGTLCLTSNDEFDINEIKVVAYCVALVNEPNDGISIGFDSDGFTVDKGEGTDRSFNILWLTRVTVSNALHFSAGNKQEFPFIVKLPESYEPAKGTMIKTKWGLRGKADVYRRLGISSKEIQFNVVDPNQAR